MYPTLRAATNEEVEKIAEDSALDRSCLVLALDLPNGETHVAVLRTSPEVDPVFYAEHGSPASKVIFIRDIETFLKAKGIDRYYFNVPVDAEEYQRNVEKWGCERLSKTPEYRYVKIFK